MLIKRHKPGCAENDIMVKPVKILLTKLQLGAPAYKIQRIRP